MTFSNKNHDNLLNRNSLMARTLSHPCFSINTLIAISPLKAALLISTESKMKILSSPWTRNKLYSQSVEKGGLIIECLISKKSRLLAPPGGAGGNRYPKIALNLSKFGTLFS
jgi:hypothetical protein